MSVKMHLLLSAVNFLMSALSSAVCVLWRHDRNVCNQVRANWNYCWYVGMYCWIISLVCLTSASEYMRIYVYYDCIFKLECKPDQNQREHYFMLPMVCFYLSVAVGLFCFLYKLVLLLPSNSFGKYSSAVSSGTTALQETYFWKVSREHKWLSGPDLMFYFSWRMYCLNFSVP